MRTLALALTFTTAAALAQSPAGVLRFDVVSIKRNTANDIFSNGSSERPDGGFTLVNVPMMTLIGRAQFPAIAPIDMVGLPEWAQRDRWDVSARSPLSRPATPEERASMLRAMLTDRVKLVTHREQRQLPVFDLVLARSDGRLGPGIAPSAIDCVAKAAADRAAADAAAAAGTPPLPPAIDFNAPPATCAPVRVNSGLEGDVTMEFLARMLRPAAGRPIVDKTGLKGSYRVKVQYDRAIQQSGPEVTPSPNALPSVFVALPEQLGLKLEASRAPQDVLVIDRLERPTEN